MLQVVLRSDVKSNMWDMVQVDNCALSEAEPAVVEIPIICNLLNVYRLVAALNSLMTHNFVTLMMRHLVLLSLMAFLVEVVSLSLQKSRVAGLVGRLPEGL